MNISLMDDVIRGKLNIKNGYLPLLKWCILESFPNQHALLLSSSRSHEV